MYPIDPRPGHPPVYRQSRPAAYFQVTPIRRPTLARKFKQLSDAGVVMLVGTDSGIPMKSHSSSTSRELDGWVNILGVAPMEAIRGATSTSACCSAWTPSSKHGVRYKQPAACNWR